MSIAVSYVSQLSVVETLEGEFISPSDNTVTTNGMNRSEGLTGASLVPVTKYSAFQLALTAGAATLDFTSLPDLNGTAGAVDATGLKLQMAKFRNKSDNANSMSITKGAANGYGTTAAGGTFTVPLDPDQEWTLYLDEKAPDVSGTVKTIDITGTGAQVIEVFLVFG